jgi:hypothetical protein
VIDYERSNERSRRKTVGNERQTAMDRGRVRGGGVCCVFDCDDGFDGLVGVFDDFWSMTFAPDKMPVERPEHRIAGGDSRSLREWRGNLPTFSGSLAIGPRHGARGATQRATAERWIGSTPTIPKRPAWVTF